MKPRVAISLGDPLGIGGEVVAKALATPGLTDALEPVVFGDQALLSPPYVLTLDDKEAARQAATALHKATDAVMAGEVQALCTAPLNKAALMAIDGGPFMGQTGYLAYRCKGSPLMVFVGPSLRVALLTVHVPIAEVSKLLASIGVGGIARRLGMLADGLKRDLGIASPRLALLGLNPHAGEKGMMGGEEKQLLFPAVDEARAAGVQVEGPFSSDGLFSQVAAGEASYDGIMACYHDQGLVGFKALAPRGAAQMSMGLSVVRASCQHGTARDIAGQDRADPSSMVAALRLAAEVARRRAQAEA